ASARLDLPAEAQDEPTRRAPGDAPRLGIVGEVDLDGDRPGYRLQRGVRAARPRDVQGREQAIERRVPREHALQIGGRAGAGARNGQREVLPREATVLQLEVRLLGIREAGPAHEAVVVL